MERHPSLSLDVSIFELGRRFRRSQSWTTVTRLLVCDSDWLALFPRSHCPPSLWASTRIVWHWPSLERRIFAFWGPMSCPPTTTKTFENQKNSNYHQTRMLTTNVSRPLFRPFFLPPYRQSLAGQNPILFTTDAADAAGPWWLLLGILFIQGRWSENKQITK